MAENRPETDLATALNMHGPEMKGFAEMAVAKVSHHKLVPHNQPQHPLSSHTSSQPSPLVSWWLQRMEAHQKHTTPSPSS